MQQRPGGSCHLADAAAFLQILQSIHRKERSGSGNQLRRPAFRQFFPTHAAAEILRQLDEIRQGLWEDWELTAARESLLSALQALGDSQGALENYYLGLAATGRRETPEEMAALLRQVTPERIRAAAQSVQLDTIYFLKGKEA